MARQSHSHLWYSDRDGRTLLLPFRFLPKSGVWQAGDLPIDSESTHWTRSDLKTGGRHIKLYQR